MNLHAVSERTLSWLRTTRNTLQNVSPRFRLAGLLLALLLFAIGMVLSVRAQPGLFTQLELQFWLLLLLIGVPVSVLQSVVEFQILARAAGQNSPFAHAVEVTIIGSAANMLPVPGSALTRIMVLNARGLSFGRSTALTTIFGTIWITVAFLYSAVWLLRLESYVVGAVFAAIGLSAGAASVLVYERVGNARKYLFYGTLLRVFGAFFAALKMSWAFAAFGIEIDFAQASVFVVTAVVAAASSIVPAGLGVSELVAAALGPFVSIAPAEAFLASGMVRLTTVLVLLPLAAVLAIISGRRLMKSQHADQSGQA